MCFLRCTRRLSLGLTRVGMALCGRGGGTIYGARRVDGSRPAALRLSGWPRVLGKESRGRGTRLKVKLARGLRRERERKKARRRAMPFFTPGARLAPSVGIAGTVHGVQQLSTSTPEHQNTLF